jgi:predicted Rossmann-fold nucleotide-binding protein
VTWSQLGIQQKPCGLLNIERYWDGLLAVLDHAVDEQFVRPENSQLVLVAFTPEGMLERLADWTPPAHIEKWLDPTKR